MCFRSAVLTYGMPDTLRMDAGREFYLSRHAQARAQHLRYNKARLAYLRTQSKQVCLVLDHFKIISVKLEQVQKVFFTLNCVRIGLLWCKRKHIICIIIHVMYNISINQYILLYGLNTECSCGVPHLFNIAELVMLGHIIGFMIHEI